MDTACFQSLPCFTWHSCLLCPYPVYLHTNTDTHTHFDSCNFGIILSGHFSTTILPPALLFHLVPYLTSLTWFFLYFHFEGIGIDSSTDCLNSHTQGQPASGLPHRNEWSIRPFPLFAWERGKYPDGPSGYLTQRKIHGKLKWSWPLFCLFAFLLMLGHRLWPSQCMVFGSSSFCTAGLQLPRLHVQKHSGTFR